MLHIPAFAEAGGKRLLQLCHESRELAKAPWRYLGHHADSRLREKVKKFVTESPNMPKAQIAKVLSYSRTTVYKLLKELAH